MKLPYPPSSIEIGVRSYLTNLVAALIRSDATKVDRNTAVGSILLASPNGSVYTVQVTDAGAITTMKVLDGA
jgi:hypothetical protein